METVQGRDVPFPSMQHIITSPFVVLCSCQHQQCGACLLWTSSTRWRSMSSTACVRAASTWTSTSRWGCTCPVIVRYNRCVDSTRLSSTLWSSLPNFDLLLGFHNISFTLGCHLYCLYCIKYSDVELLLKYKMKLQCCSFTTFIILCSSRVLHHRH